MADSLPLPSPADERKVRDRLLDAASHLFTVKGYAATSVSEIVAAAGVTKPILYYYFKNKEGIYLEIMKDGYGRLDRLLDEAEAWAGPAWARIQRLGTRIRDLFVENLTAARMIYAFYYVPPQGAPEYDHEAHLTRYLKVLERFVREGIAGGELKTLDAMDIALGVAGIIELALDLELRDRGLHLDGERLVRLLTMFLNGVSNQCHC